VTGAPEAQAPRARYVLAAYRLFFGLLTLIALGRQLLIQLHEGHSLVNFFSYFTNLSNLLAAVVFLAGGLQLFGRRTPSASFDIVRGTAVVCMAVVGIVFSVLLRDEDLGSLLPWVNAVVHFVMPVAVVADWFFQPPATKLWMRHVGYWLIFPLLYLAYSIARGALGSFYAYPFFDPAKSGGYGGVALYCAGILFLFLLLSWLAVASANRLRGSDHVSAVHL
jgi:hypothetical protein